MRYISVNILFKIQKKNLLDNDNSARQKYAESMEIEEFMNVKKLGFG